MHETLLTGFRKQSTACLGQISCYDKGMLRVENRENIPVLKAFHLGHSAPFTYLASDKDACIAVLYICCVSKSPFIYSCSRVQKLTLTSMQNKHYRKNCSEYKCPNNKL